MKVLNWLTKLERRFSPKPPRSVLIVSEDYRFARPVKYILEKQGCWVEEVTAPVAAVFSSLLANGQNKLSLVLVMADIAPDPYLAFIEWLRRGKGIGQPIVGCSPNEDIRRAMQKVGANYTSEPDLWEETVMPLLS